MYANEISLTYSICNCFHWRFCTAYQSYLARSICWKRHDKLFMQMTSFEFQTEAKAYSLNSTFYIKENPFNGYIEKPKPCIFVRHLIVNHMLFWKSDRRNQIKWENRYSGLTLFETLTLIFGNEGSEAATRLFGSLTSNLCGFRYIHKDIWQHVHPVYGLYIWNVGYQALWLIRETTIKSNKNISWH